MKNKPEQIPSSRAKAKKPHEWSFYFSVIISLVFLGFIALQTITLSHVAIMALGSLVIVIILLFTLTSLSNLLLVFVLYLPFSRLLPGDFSTGFWAFNLTNILTICLIFGIVIEKMKSHISLSPFSSLTIPIFLFCLLGVFSFVKSASYFGYFYFNQFLSSLKEWLSPILLFFFFLIAVKDKRDIKRIVMLVMLITLCISMLIVFEYLAIRGAEDFEKTRAGAIFEQPNRAGAFFVYYGFFLITFFLLNARKIKYWFLLAPILLSLRALMYTFSRGAMLAFVGASLFLAFLKNKFLFLFLLISTVFVVLNPQVLPTSLYKRFTSTFLESDAIYQQELKDELEPSAKTRVVVWTGAVSMIKDHPFFGVGYGVFPYMIPFYAPVQQLDAHNMYLTIAAELGIPALVIFLLIIALIFKNTWFVYKHSKDNFIKAFALGFLAGIIGLLLCNIFGSRLESQEISGLFWVLAALIYKAKALIKQKKETEAAL